MLVLIGGGWLFLTVTSPRVVRLEDLSTGACLHVPTSSNGDVTAARAIGTDQEVGDVLALQGAEVAPCDASHSHEVAATFSDTDAPGTAYPGQPTLVQRHEAACEAAFASYVGHPVDGSSLSLTVVVQRQAGWDAGHRSGACLVNRADGGFLGSSARGSGQ